MNMCYLIKPQTNLNPSCWMSPNKLWTALIKFPITSNRRTKSFHITEGDLGDAPDREGRCSVLLSAAVGSS